MIWYISTFANISIFVLVIQAIYFSVVKKIIRINCCTDFLKLGFPVQSYNIGDGNNPSVWCDICLFLLIVIIISLLSVLLKHALFCIRKKWYCVHYTLTLHILYSIVCRVSMFRLANDTKDKDFNSYTYRSGPIMKKAWN